MKTSKSKTTKKKVVKKSSIKKTGSKNSATNKSKTIKIEKVSYDKNTSNAIEDELLKITNIKSVEQIKKPRKIAFMITFYAVILIAFLVFCLIRFSKPNKNNLLLKESIDYEYLTEEVVTSTERIIEESSTESSRQITTKAWPKRTSAREILPKFREVIYDYPTYYQMSQDELNLLNNLLTESYNSVKDNVFGESVSFTNKGANGILYLNYTYLKEYTDTYNNDIKEIYNKLPVAPYYNYVMNDKFNFDYKSYSANLKMKLDFKNAKNQGLYYEIPATVYEPTGSNVSANGTNKISVRVLKRAKIGYTESFSLTALLEVLDIECHTKHNPFFDIDDLVGSNPKAIIDMKESGFDVRSMIDDEIFNYVLFDKKGYITALYMLKS